MEQDLCSQCAEKLAKNRVLLFKGKRRDNGKWVTYNLSEALFNGVREKQINDFIDSDPETVCQYIGFNDRNFKEVFEHDLLLIGAGTEFEETLEVFYDPKLMGYLLRNPINPEQLPESLDNIDQDDVLIIGNIFD